MRTLCQIELRNRLRPYCQTSLRGRTTLDVVPNVVLTDLGGSEG